MLKDRLHKRRKELKLSREALAEKAGVSTSTITFLENGRNESSKHLVEIASALGVSAEWLKDGVESNAIVSKNEQSNATIIQKGVGAWDKDTELPDDMAAIPFYKELSLSAGHGAWNDQCNNDSMKLWFAKSFLKRMNTSQEHVFCVTVHGDSMEPRYDEGGVVMVDTLPQTIIDGKAYAIHHDGEDFIKYLRRLPDNRVLISSENPIYKSYERDLSEITIIGRIVCYQREE